MEDFKRVIRTAQRLFDVPVALINLSDAQAPGNNGESWLEPDQSFSDEILHQDFISSGAPFIVPDAVKDSRFQNHALLACYPNIGFYAEMPLHDPNGDLAGSLCLIDFKPRVFEATEVAALEDIAAWAELKLDVLRVKRINTRLREKKTRLQAIIASAGDAIITFGEDGEIKIFNPAASRIFGHAASNIIGNNVGRLVAEGSRSQIGSCLQELISGKAGQEIQTRRELMGLHASGTEFEAETVIAQIQIKGEREFIAIVRDISEAKKIERMKGDFVSTVSHELRTPLTSIRGSLGLLLGSAAGVIPAGAKKLLNIANNNCERLIRLINDLLDLQKIEAGHMNFNMGVHSLVPLVHQAIEATQSFALQFQVQFNFESSDSDGLICVSVDPDRLVRVIVNLLSNAAKFSPPGSAVDIRIKQQSELVRLSVIDQGPGIPDEFRGQIFNRFSQFNNPNSCQKTGAGLGLSISKTIIEKLGGKVGFYSKPGQGSEFFLDLPVAVSLRSISLSTENSVIYETARYG